MNSDQIGVGVVGLGFMGATHLRAYQLAEREGFPCKLVAVCDSRANRREGFLGDVGGNMDTGGAPERAFDPSLVRGYESPSELFANPNVHLVSICTPTNTHVELAIAALRTGKHVLCEKPVALHVADIRRIESVAREVNRICMPAMCMRFWPGWSWLRDRITDRQFGQCLSLTLTRLGAAPTWSPGFYNDPTISGGALVDLHIHDSDFVYHCFGKPAAVLSTGTLNHLTTQYLFDHGPKSVVAEGGWITPGFPFRMRYTAVFEEATADFDIGRDPRLLLTHDNKTEPIKLDELAGYDVELRHLLAVIASGAQTTLATLDDAANVTALLDAERQSMDTSQITRYNAAHS